MLKKYKTSKSFSKVEEEEVDIMVKYYQEGKLIKEIGKLLNRERPTVRKHLNNRLGKDRKSNKKVFEITPEIERKVLELYKTTPLYKIMQIVNIPLWSLKKIIPENSKFCRKYSLNEHYFDSIDTSNKAYFLGLIYADGNIGKKNNSLTLKLQTKDKEILEELNKELECTRQISYDLPRKICNTKYVSSGNYTLQVTSPIIKNSLLQLGVCPNKTFIISFPYFLKPEFYSHFIRGFFDGDGTVGFYQKNKAGRVSFVGTLGMLLPIKDLLEKEGIPMTLRKEIRNKNTYYIEIYKRKSILDFSDYIYKDAKLFIKRKYEKFEELKKLTYDKRTFEEGFIWRRDSK